MIHSISTDEDSDSDLLLPLAERLKRKKYGVLKPSPVEVIVLDDSFHCPSRSSCHPLFGAQPSSSSDEASEKVLPAADSPGKDSCKSSTSSSSGFGSEGSIPCYNVHIASTNKNQNHKSSADHDSDRGLDLHCISSSDEDEPACKVFNKNDAVEVCIVDIASSQQMRRKKVTQEEKQRREEEKELKRFQKTEAKKRKKALVELEKQKKDLNKQANKLGSSSNCQRSCIAQIDETLMEQYSRKEEIQSVFAENEAVFEISESAISNSVMWKRVRGRVEEALLDLNEDGVMSSQPTLVTSETIEDHMLVVLNMDKVVPMVCAFKKGHLGEAPTSDSFLDYVLKTLQNNSMQQHLTFVFYGLNGYLRRIASRENHDYQVELGIRPPPKQLKKTQSMPSITKEDVDMCVFFTQFRLSETEFSWCKLNVHFIDNSKDLAAYIYRSSKAVATKPWKQKRSHQEGFEWYAEGDKGRTFDVSGPEDIKKTWTHQLMQFSKVSYAIASGIADKYPSVLKLRNEYLKMAAEEGEKLLSSIEIVRSGRSRRVGKELSRRIYCVLMSKDPELLLD